MTQPVAFSLSGNYSPTADTTSLNLIDDANCFRESAKGILQVVAYTLSTQRESSAMTDCERDLGSMMYGATYLLNMADSLRELAHEKELEDAEAKNQNLAA